MKIRLILSIAIILLISLVLALPVCAKVIYVRTDGNDSNDGSSWELAKQTVQAGLDASSGETNDEVWVAKGTYVECITLTAGVKLYGGFTGNETTLAERSAFPRHSTDPNETVLDGNKGGSVVTSPAGATESTRIDGFTIRNGSGTLSGSSRRYGGGIYCQASSPTISNNTISSNHATTGGGIYCSSASPTIVNNTISGNGASAGGGIYCYISSPTITNNNISGNNATTSNTISGGGGICCDSSSPTISGNIIKDNVAFDCGGICSYDSSPTISNNIIKDNTASYNGGGICSYDSSPTISNNIITGNIAGYYGGGILCAFSSMTISNNTIINNSAQYGGGIGYDDYCSPKVSNNIIAFNSSGIYVEISSPPMLNNNCVYNPDGYNYSGLSAGTGDISADPLFVDRLSGNYHIRWNSPCVNRGWNDAPGLPEIDMDGQGRIFRGTVDIGADEYWPILVQPNIIPTGIRLF